MLTRRALLGTAATASVAATTLAGCSGDDRPPTPRAGDDPSAVAPPRPGDWASVRAQFNLKPGIHHMSTFVFASHPAPVRAAIERHRRGLDEDAHGYLRKEEDLDTAVATAAARYLGGAPAQVAFTDSTTMGLALLYSGIALKPGEEILTTEHDFYATHESLRLRAARDGATVRRVRLYADPATVSVDEVVSNLRAALTPRTRVVALTWVHSGTGVRLPVRQLADAVHNAVPGALVCLDGVHGLGAVDASPEQLGVDFLVAGCHKWLFGPRGTGVVWGRPEAWPAVTPVIPSFDTPAIVAWLTGRSTPATSGPVATPGGYHSFEHRWALAEAFTFHSGLGRSSIAGRTTALATRLKEGLSRINGVVVRTPASPDLSAGIVCCELRGVLPETAVTRLREQQVDASTTPYATTYLRFGPSIATDESSVDATLAAVRTLL